MGAIFVNARKRFWVSEQGLGVVVLGSVWHRWVVARAAAYNTQDSPTAENDRGPNSQLG